ncbi:DUF4351 domain-containing protein [Planktothrix sp. FACHB-1355]|uniref:DUF4351 domain-containing protein n=1 Tax=Aerosakkonema funiforme FACHB-1375 TaxID=2949571 RepID=A0A926VGD9_9CYAN|nr:DUF4351 domain-containing protein [Aerosakkonema funiforme FACHB-1375]MBD3561266.1 DUF4351 domain-containing protein [Planktothrix sp. FACHB-1355]
MQPITLQENQAAIEARNLLARSQQELPSETSRAILEMVTTIMVYKFTQLSRAEVEAMLGISLQQTRVYQEAREDEAKLLILRQLTRRVGEVPESVRVQIDPLSITQLESLAEALLDFSNLSDLDAWLAQQGA